MKVNNLIALALLALPLMANAQFDTGGGSSSSSSSSNPWAELKMNKNTRIKLDFKNANPDMVISLLIKSSGITIVKDPTFKTPISVTSAKAVPLEEAFQIFSTVVGLAGYDMKKEGTIVVIRKKPDRSQGRTGGAPNPFQGGIPPGMNLGGGGRGGEEEGVLRVYPIRNANASSVARVINDVYQPQAGGGNNRGGFPGGGGRTFQIMGGDGQPQQGGQRGPTVRASSDDYSNTVIVNAPRNQQEQVEELIKSLDVSSEQPEDTRIFPLVYATADQLAPVVQNVLINNAPKGRGGSGNTNVPFEQRFQQALRFGGSQSAFGTVVADARTNSLVITATPENLDIVGKVIEKLDQPVEVQNSTFVIPLDNARSDTMAELLNNAFGGGGGRNTNNNRFGNNNNNRFGGQNNRFGGGGGNRFGGGGGFGGRGVENGRAEENPDELEVPLEDPNAESGPLATQVFFGGGFGGGQGGRNTAQQPARDAQGRITNIRDLAGQISVISDPNTNSLIIIGTPENAELIRSIIEQLDKIPEQVMIETIIVEASLDSSSKMGVEWQFSQDRAFGKDGLTGNGTSNFGLPASPAGAGFRYTLTGQNFQALLNALKTDQKFNILSTPRIFTSNNVEAEINISQRVPFVVSQREDANGNLTFNYDFEDVGIVLTVTPRISANGIVTMDVIQTANDLQGFTDFNAPIVNQREAQTTVSVRDGETIVLGGIMRSTVTSTVRKVPLLGDIPILGELFKSTDRSNQKTELLVFLTPRIVRNPDDARKLREDTQKEMSKPSQKQIEGAIEKTNGGGEVKP